MTSVHEIKDRLLRVIGKDGSVLNLPAVMEILVILEKTNVTRDELEETRIGKYINDVRRATSDQLLQKRAKKLIKTWQQMISKQGAATKNSRSSNNSPSLKSRSVSSTTLDSMNNKRVPSPITSVNGGAKLSSSMSKKKGSSANLTAYDKKESKTKSNSKSRQSLPKNRSAPNLTESAKSSFTCKPNGLKITFKTKPSGSSSSQKPTLSSVHEDRDRLKRKRQDSPDLSAQVTNRTTSKIDLSASAKPRTVKNEIEKSSKSNSKSDKVYNYSDAYRTERKTASPLIQVVDKIKSQTKKSVSPKILEPDKPTQSPDDFLLKDSEYGNAILSSIVARNIGSEAAGVDGCRTNDGLWHSWSDSFLLQRSQSDPVSTENPDEPDVLSILPYVELE